MSRSLLTLPPELLVQILTFLPISPLLKFSQTCRTAHSLATSSLHTLSLGIHPTRVSSIIARLAATQYPRPKEAVSFFSTPDYPSLSESGSSWDSSEMAMMTESPLSSNDPYQISVLIPDAQSYDYITLLTFHTALTRSVLTRHGHTLRNLDLSLWTLTLPTAKALAGLEALRVLSLQIEDFPHVRAVPRTQVATQRAEEREAWRLLTSTAAWAARLDALRIEGGEVSTAQLCTLLRKSRWCRELWVCKCAFVGRGLWAFLGQEWEGRTALRILGVMRCGGRLDEEVLDCIGGLEGLQFLTLHGCHGVDSEEIERRNREEWGIKEVIPPMPKLRPREEGVGEVIEVDPAYMDDEE